LTLFCRHEELNDSSSNDGFSLGKEEEEYDDQKEKPLPRDFDEEVEKQKYLRLTFLLEKTSLYSDFLSQKLNLAIDEKKAAEEKATTDETEIEQGTKRKRGKKVSFTWREKYKNINL
jgi:hypothetical protein